MQTPQQAGHDHGAGHQTAGHAHDGREAAGHGGVGEPSGSAHAAHRGASGGGHHDHMVADFRRRFRVSLALTVPVLALSPMVQELLGLGHSIRFPGDLLLLFAASTLVFAYGGFPFSRGWSRRSAPGGQA
jgi:Cu2+-exporting ATPase